MDLLMNVPGYNRSYIVNPYVFADLNQPQRWRGAPQAVNRVFQTRPPEIRDVYLDAVVEALDDDVPPMDGAFVGAHMQPGTALLGNYEDRTSRGGTQQHGTRLTAVFRGGAGPASHPAARGRLHNALRARPQLLRIRKADDVIWWPRVPGPGGDLAAEIVVRMNGTDLGSLLAELARAIEQVNREVGSDLHLVALLDSRDLTHALWAPSMRQLGNETDQFADQMVQALFSEHPDQLIVQAPVRAPAWWERTYLGIPTWALGGLGIFALGTVGWAYRRRSGRAR